jgi:hypothetical protein
VFVAHFPQAPLVDPSRKQKGAVVVPHASDVPEPWSPLHGWQVEVAESQMGVSPEHCAELVHWTQVLVAALQCGAVAGHCESIAHATQTMLLPQMPERQTVPPFVAEQGPSPFA